MPNAVPAARQMPPPLATITCGWSSKQHPDSFFSRRKKDVWRFHQEKILDLQSSSTHVMYQ